MLLDAVSRGRLYQVKFLLDGTDGTHDVNKTDGNKQTALMKAVFLDDKMRSTRQKIARILLAHGADVNTVDREGKTALMWACIKGRHGIVKTLLEKSIIDLDMNAADDAGNTALFYAASEGRTKIVQMLVKAMLRFGLDIDKKNARGMTPLLEATKRGHDLCAQVLMTEGQASLTIRDPQMFMNTHEWAQKRSLLHLSELIAQRVPSPSLIIENICNGDGDDEDDRPARDVSGQHTVYSRLRSVSRNSQTHTANRDGYMGITKSPSLQEMVLDRLDKPAAHEVQRPGSHYLSTPELHSDKNAETQKLSGQVSSKVSLQRRKSAQLRAQPVTAKSEMCRLLGLYGIQHSGALRQGYDPISLPPSGFWPDPLAHLRDNMSTVSSDDLESLCELKPRLMLNRRKSSAVSETHEVAGSGRRGSNTNFLRESRRTSLMPSANFGRRSSNIPTSPSSQGLKSFLEVPGRRTSLMPQGEKNRRPQISRRVTTSTVM